MRVAAGKENQLRKVKIREIRSKSILSPSKIHDYVVNPYVGCAHGCSYCYARYMKRFTGHGEPWGEFVDVKINAAQLLDKEIRRKRKGTMWMSGVCDPYQPLEAKYELTRRCLGIIIDHGWPLSVQTRSPLVLRDLDILRKGKDVEAGFSITTADERIRKMFEPCAPPIPARLKALRALHDNGVRTFVMIAPILPGAVDLIDKIEGIADHIIIDRMNYNHADHIYKKHNLTHKNTDGYFAEAGELIAAKCREKKIELMWAY